MSTEKLLDSLRCLHKDRRRILRRMKQDNKLAMGTVSVVYRKCGNPRCHCADNGEGHPQTLFLFKDKLSGKRKCKLIRRADEEWVLRAGQNYKRFREDMKTLRAIDKEEKQILMALAEIRSIRYE
jgi:hypothetical protein